MKIRFALFAFVLLAGSLVAQVKDFKPVTEAMLRNPAPGDWLNWRRTDNAWGYSPLDQITRQNVSQLQLAWSWAMDDTGANEMTPLVYDGIMYLPNPRGVIQALDAATGDLIWSYRPTVPTVAAGSDASRGIQRNLAIFGDKIYGTTGDAHIIALDARTGKVAWDTKVANSELGYGYTSGPIVVRGKVIAGMTGCTRYKDDVCFITGHDANTGKELWRTSTIARPGEPGGDTWGNLALTFRAGGDAWIPASYDPETNLVYIGTAQAKPWARAARGTDGDALYTNSTLALDPDTGKMKWFYQHLPGETQDMDEVFERILVDAGGRKSVFEMGKLGILWQLDRATGQFIHATDLGYQNVVQLNAQTGKVTYLKVPQIGAEADWCPSTAGFKSWRAMSYNPQTGAFYIPMNLTCEKGTFGAVEKVAGKGGTGPVARSDYKHPESGGNLGEFLAMDLQTGRVLWRQRTPAPSNTAALSTAGGIVFGGDWDRRVYAYDATSGKILWQSRLPTSAQGFPITYLAKGKQYVALPTGIGGGSWSTLIPPELAPEIKRPTNGGNGIFVFALPSPDQRSEAVQPADKYATVSGLKIHYLDWGSEGKPPLIVLHGIRRSAHTFDHIAPHFASNYHVIAVDMRGHGESAWDPKGAYMVEDYTKDIEALVEQLHLRNIVIWGNSTGGRVAQVFAGMHPDLVSSVISEDVGPERPTEIANNFAAQARPKDAKWDPAIGNGFVATELWRFVRQIKSPIIYILGGKSTIVPPATQEELKRTLPQVQITTIAGVGHYPSEEKTPDFLAIADKFLSSK